jgi:hypothetical protein
VVGSVIQATGKSTFEDGLRLGMALVRTLHYHTDSNHVDVSASQ